MKSPDLLFFKTIKTALQNNYERLFLVSDFENCLDQLKETLPAVNETVLEALTPTGKLRAGISLSNFLLVTGKSDSGMPQGVSPDIAQALAKLLSCEVDYITYDSPGAVADAAKEEAWDIGNIGADPARASFINFTEAYCEIESTCLVLKDSTIKSFADVDKPGIKISTKSRAAYTLWLERNLKHAQLVQFDTMDASVTGFIEQKFDVLAGLKPRLLEDEQRLPETRLLSDKFAAVQQAIGTPANRNKAGVEYLELFVKQAKKTGLVEALINQHNVTGKLSVAGN